MTATIVLCGPTAAGKSTIAARLAEFAGLHRLAAEQPSALADDRRRADLKLLRELDDCPRPAVVESSALPGLLPVNNTALIVRLTASTPVRSLRLRTRSPEMTYAAANHQLELTDATTCERLRSAWGIDISALQANRWGADLVVGCPEPEECADELACTEIVTLLITAAYNVYEHYLSAEPGREALAMFRDFRRTYFEHVRRCGTALVGPVAEFTPAAWRGRHATELERRARIL